MFNAKHFPKPELKRAAVANPTTPVAAKPTSPWVAVDPVLPEDVSSPSPTPVSWVDDLKTQVLLVQKIKDSAQARWTHVAPCPYFTGQSMGKTQDRLVEAGRQSSLAGSQGSQAQPRGCDGCTCPPLPDKPFNDPDTVKFVFDLLSGGPKSSLSDGIKQFTVAAGNLAAQSAAGGTPTYLNSIVPGSDYYQRLGRSVTMIRHTVHIETAWSGVSQVFANVDTPFVRVSLVYDKMPALSQIWAENVIPPTGATALMNTEGGGTDFNSVAIPHEITHKVRYEILKDRTVIPEVKNFLNAGVAGTNYVFNGSSIHHYDTNMHGRKCVWYAAGGTNLLSGQMLMWLTTDATSNAYYAPTSKYISTIYFKDDAY
jgi:hypothetical protein